MKIKFLFLLFVIIVALSIGCIESKKLPTPNETKVPTPETPTYTPKQELPTYNNETKPLKINNTFETWSRGYSSNTSYDRPYFRVITNYSEWNEFLDNQGAWFRGGTRIEGQIFPGLNIIPNKINPNDFNNYFIMAAMMGWQARTGPEIEIKNINRSNNIVNVTVRMDKPGPGGNVVSAPYHIVIVKRELLPIGNSTFIFRDTEGKELGIVEIKSTIQETGGMTFEESIERGLTKQN